ncbi:uncharacterized protein LOC123889733 [Trifolium pratense]|uniref:uncharacterized protein LOC123889733 n=1 Tax=Trifolium pratense TaxID=57577 RepID=UPI001E693010|nr:uncharacterized protein LOC123889733 [Trifolium pratense]
MKVDSDPLPPADATYVEVYDCNMVEVIDAAAPIKAVPEEEYEKRVREVYPNAEEELVDFLNRCKLKNAEVMLCPRNSPKESTGSTPFRLTYGHDAVLPVEIMMQSIRVQRQWELPPDHYGNIMLDELTDVDEERLQALDALIRQKERIARAYNKRVKSKLFGVGDLVWKVILPMDRRDRVFGKWVTI